MVIRTPRAQPTLTPLQARQRAQFDELVQHRHVWLHLAEQAWQVAHEFPFGSVEQSTLLRLAAVAPDVADLLKRAADAEQAAAS